MYPDGRVIHLGINFLFSPMRSVDKVSSVRFQNELINVGIDDFDKINHHENEIDVAREKPSPLQIKVAAMPAPPPVGLIGQLLVLSPWPTYTIRGFGEDAEAVVRALENTWPVQKRQLVSCDTTVRVLYQSTAEHAFQEIWETFLGRPATSLAGLGRQVMGGGIRFVMPPQPDEVEVVQIEVKIESWFKDTSQVFVEAQHRWNPPLHGFESINRVEQVYSYIDETVVPFIQGES